MTDQNVCAECTLPIDPDAFASAVSDEVEEDGKFYHWSCAQELYERERIADGEEG